MPSFRKGGVEGHTTSSRQLVVAGEGARAEVKKIVDLWRRVRPTEERDLVKDIEDQIAMNNGQNMFTKTRTYRHTADIPQFIAMRMRLKFGPDWKGDASLRKALYEELPACVYPSNPKPTIVCPGVPGHEE